MSISIAKAKPDLSYEIALMTGELLEEIMDAIHRPAFHFVLDEAQKRLRSFIADERYHVFVAIDAAAASKPIGFVSLYESFSIYAGGAFGTIPELYVRPAYRQQETGRRLIESVKEFGRQQGWTRLEVTTPPLPEFQRTLEFYEREGFCISGGKKLQLGL